MNVQSLQPLLPHARDRISVLLSAAFAIQAELPPDIEQALSNLASRCRDLGPTFVGLR
jgi:hypothetical protein